MYWNCVRERHIQRVFGRAELLNKEENQVVMERPVSHLVEVPLSRFKQCVLGSLVFAMRH